MKMKHLITVLSSFALGHGAMAQESVPVQQMMESGVYYTLSKNLAQHLGLDYEAIKTQAELKEGEILVVKKNEQDGEIDVTIFDKQQFAAARMDLLK